MTRPPSKLCVVVNTSPLIVLDRIKLLPILKGLFGRVYRPYSVETELRAGLARHQVSDRLFDTGWLITEPDPPEAIWRRELGAGERAAIALAMTRKADLIVLDDLQARLVAGDLGLRITGTIGLLLQARTAGLIAPNIPLPDLLLDAGFRVAPHLLKLLKK